MTTYAEFYAYFLAEYTKLGFEDAAEAAAADAALAVSNEHGERPQCS